MLRSLYSGVSGMRSFQTKMDVISNNIANVNTTGFKSERAKFQDMLSQTSSNAKSPTEKGLGGVNPQQVGLGVKVGSIDKIMMGGPLQPTNRELDFAIEGEGFFILSDVSDGDNKFYTRDGAFFRDHEGNLVNGSGMRVMGYEGESGKSLKPLKIPNEDGGKKLEEYSIDGSGQITAKYEGVTKPKVIGHIAIAKFTNPEGLEKVGSNNFVESSNSGEAQDNKPGEKGFGYVRQGFLEMSNVDLANEFTEMIVTNRAYQANSRSITTSDEMLQELINLKR